MEPAIWGNTNNSYEGNYMIPNWSIENCTAQCLHVYVQSVVAEVWEDSGSAQIKPTCLLWLCQAKCCKSFFAPS